MTEDAELEGVPILPGVAEAKSHSSGTFLRLSPPPRYPFPPCPHVLMESSSTSGSPLLLAGSPLTCACICVDDCITVCVDRSTPNYGRDGDYTFHMREDEGLADLYDPTAEAVTGNSRSGAAAMEL